MSVAPDRTGNSYLDAGVTVPVGDVVRSGLVRCTRKTTAAEIAGLMRAGAQAVAVMEDRGQLGERVWGIVCGPDLVKAVAADDPRISAEALAATPVIRVRADQTLREAARAMVGAHVPGVLIIEPAHGQAIGWLSALDLARRLTVTSPGPASAAGEDAV
jgi:CBS domain-containing protein